MAHAVADGVRLSGRAAFDPPDQAFTPRLPGPEQDNTRLVFQGPLDLLYMITLDHTFRFFHLIEG